MVHACKDVVWSAYKQWSALRLENAARKWRSFILEYSQLWLEGREWGIRSYCGSQQAALRWTLRPNSLKYNGY